MRLNRMVRILGVVMVVALLVAAFGCGGAPPAPSGSTAPGGGSPAPAPVKIRLTAGIDPVYAGWYVADKQGIFKKNGLEATLQLFAVGTEGMNAIVSGQADVAGTSPTAPLVAIDKGADSRARSSG